MLRKAKNKGRVVWLTSLSLRKIKNSLSVLQSSFLVYFTLITISLYILFESSLRRNLEEETSKTGCGIDPNYTFFFIVVVVVFNIFPVTDHS